MGCSKRYLLAVVLFMLVASAGQPALPEASASVDPSEVVLPGGGANATMELEVVKDSVVLSAHLSVSGSPYAMTEEVPVSSGTSIGFQGGVDFVQPNPDLSWYLGSLLDDADLDNASIADGVGILTTASNFAYQLFLVSVNPVDLYSITVSWTGRANATVANESYQGAALYVMNNATKSWEAVDAYADLLEDDHSLSSQSLMAPWRYVNRTLTGEDKVIVLVISHRGFDSRIHTDALTVTTDKLTYPRPRMDLGSDGFIDWGFGTGDETGSLGHVAAFEDGSTNVDISLPMGGGSNDSTAVLVPEGAFVEQAFLDYVAYPTKGERTGGGNGITVPSQSSSTDLVISGIPSLSHSRLSSVLLTNTLKLNVTEQRQEMGGGTPQIFVGWGTFWPQSIAQSFTPGQDGPLRGIEVFVTDISGSPGSITMELRDMAGAQPTGSLIKKSVVDANDVVTGDWNYFPFDGVQLSQSVQYAFVVYTEDALQYNNLYYVDFNATDIYPSGQAFVSNNLSGGGSWASSPVDMTFRTYMDLPIKSMDAINLEVIGASGNLAGDRVYFNVSGVAYDAGSWTFQVDNLNPFGVTFDWSARTTYQLFAEEPSIDVGDDGSVEWTGINVSTTEPLDITQGLRRVLSTRDWPHMETDPFGNVLYRVPINLSGTSEGDVALRNIAVYYTGSINTSDLAADINLKKGPLTPDANGTVRIPINITSPTAGVLNVTAVNVVYDLPPYSLVIGDIDIPEDGEMDPPLVLDTVLFDDLDNNDLEYTIVRESGDENLTWNLSEINVLTFDGPANWSGMSVFHIIAEDTCWTTTAPSRISRSPHHRQGCRSTLRTSPSGSSTRTITRMRSWR
jgi:hypothetical protein